MAELAWLKAEAVAKQVEDGLVLAADTVGWLHGKVVGKPEDEADARRIIKSLSGTVHELWTASAVASPRRLAVHLARSQPRADEGAHRRRD